MADTPEAPLLARGRIALRHPAPADQGEFLASVRRSRTLHHPWVRPPDSPARFASYLERSHTPSECSFLVCRRHDARLAGVITLSHIFHGLFRSAYLGYYAFAGHEGQGLMHEGLEAVVRHAFARLRLHRLEANIQPTNTASIALVKACAFEREGYSPRYLKIGGRWRDHERWARLAS
jgi:ribosomal-protein-alanine N-acetyltransferase